MILRTTVFLALCAVILTAAPLRAAEPVYPTGSRIGMVPPRGFMASKRFPGFEDDDTQSTIILIALPPQAFAEVETTMSADAVKKQGLVEDTRENLTLPSGKAVMVVGNEEDKGQKFRKWMFVGRFAEATA